MSGSEYGDIVIVFDLDGTVISGRKVIPGAPEIVEKFIKKGFAIRYATNSGRTRVDITTILEQFYGFPVDKEWVYPASYLTAKLLRKKSIRKTLAVVGEGTINEIESKGIEVLPFHRWEKASAVVVGLDRNFNYEKILYSMLAIRSGAEFIATDRDAVYPYADELYPGSNAMVASIEGTVEVAPEVAGKPSAFIIESIVENYSYRHGREPSLIIFVGDSRRSDMGAVHAYRNKHSHGVKVIGVRVGTGVDDEGPQPDFEIESVVQLPEFVESLLGGELKWGGSAE